MDKLFVIRLVRCHMLPFRGASGFNSQYNIMTCINCSNHWKWLLTSNKLLTIPTIETSEWVCVEHRRTPSSVLIVYTLQFTEKLTNVFRRNKRTEIISLSPSPPPSSSLSLARSHYSRIFLATHRASKIIYWLPSIGGNMRKSRENTRSPGSVKWHRS